MKPDQLDSRSELKFVLVTGLLKYGVLFAAISILIGYFGQFGFSLPKPTDSLDLWNLIYKPILEGAACGLIAGLIWWRQFQKDSR